MFIIDSRVIVLSMSSANKGIDIAHFLIYNPEDYDKSECHWPIEYMILSFVTRKKLIIWIENIKFKVSSIPTDAVFSR